MGAALSVVSLLGLGLMTTGWSTMVVFLCLSGLAVAVTDPGLAILVGRAVPPNQQGRAFGIKEASIPAATLAAGLAVPAIALTVGWRWAFAVGAIPVALIIALLPRVQLRPVVAKADAAGPEPAPPPRRYRSLLLVAVGAALGTTAASGVGIFLTDSAVAMGLSPGGAGLLLAVGGIAGIVARVGAGVAADRIGGPQFKLISIMLAVGAVTIALGGTGNIILLIVGTIGVFTGSWAWTGIYFLSLIRVYPDRPGTVAGIGTAGLGVGNAAGPVLFGLVAQTFSFGAAWLGAAVVGGMAAICMAVARSRF
jgi:predicted MFS family arabinose efflux permease